MSYTTNRYLTAPEKLETNKACFASIEQALATRGLDWPPVFRQGYFGFQRCGGYHVVIVDFRPRVPLVSVKLPESPEQLGLTDPYPNLESDWDAVPTPVGLVCPRRRAGARLRGSDRSQPAASARIRPNAAASHRGNCSDLGQPGALFVPIPGAADTALRPLSQGESAA